MFMIAMSPRRIEPFINISVFLFVSGNNFVFKIILSDTTQPLWFSFGYC